MEEKEIHDELASIRSMMERSSKFISLSGLSGILAGVYALVGAAAAYYIIQNTQPGYLDAARHIELSGLIYGGDASALLIPLAAIAVIVLAASLLSGILLAMQKAKKKGQPIWSKVSRELLFFMAVPLVAGGLLIIILLLHGHYGIVSSASLIFYGLALVSASNFTFTEVRYLGLMEIALGLIAACLPGYGLLIWALGFGVLHIVYGSMMHLKYDK